MAEIKWDIKRGAQIYRTVYDGRLKSWISTGYLKRGEVVVWRSGFSGWRKPEELEELTPFFKLWEKSKLKRVRRKRPKKRVLRKKKQIKNILIIDDEKDLCRLLGDIVSSKGYSVTSANTKKEGIACLKKETPDLVFLDLKLPDGDGMSILSKIKKLNPRTIVNIISAYGGEERKEEAKKKGAYRFVDKPFTEGQILKSIG